jgi:hypothetical protein
LIAFQYRDKPEQIGALPGDPAAVAGSTARPHYGVGGFFNFSPTRRSLAAPARLTIHYVDSEISGFEETSLAIYRWNDVEQDWDRLGGTVDTAENTVSVDVSRLGLYTAAPTMPRGSIAFTTEFTAAGSQAAPTTVVTFTSGAIRSNAGQNVPDGTLFTVRPILGNQGTERPLGTVLTPDAAPGIDGVQVASQNGMIQFVAELPGALGAVVPLAFSIDGTAIADRVLPYQRPQ